MSIKLINVINHMLHFMRVEGNEKFKNFFIEFHKYNHPRLWEKEVINCKQIGLNIEECINEVTRNYKKCINFSNVVQGEAEIVTQSVGRKYNRCFSSKDVIVYIYADLNCGAGWATIFDNHYGILLGIKSMINLGYTKKTIIRKVLYHEFGHIIHWIYRDNMEDVKAFQQKGYEPVYTIYSEGFAQKIASTFLGDKCWFQTKGWPAWCKENFTELCNEYFQRVLNNKSVEDFFNALYCYKNKSQVGYYIGLQFINYLNTKYTLQKIAKLSLYEVRENLLCFLSSRSARHGV